MVRFVVRVVVFAALSAFIFTVPAVTALFAGDNVSPLFAKIDKAPNPHSTVTIHSTTAPVQYLDENLDESTGDAVIDSSPAGAQVYIDGSYRGITPLSLKGISSGQHTLLLELTGYANFSGALAVSPGKVFKSTTKLIPDTSSKPADPDYRWDDPVVLLTVFGIVTTVIGAVVTIVSIVQAKKSE